MDATKRLVEAQGLTLAAVGAQIGTSYGSNIKEGLKRSRELYEAEPVTVDKKRWKRLAGYAADAAASCCPHAHEFLQGVGSTLKSDPYEAVLDFEVILSLPVATCFIAFVCLGRCFSSSSSEVCAASEKKTPQPRL